ncbi:MAG: Fe-S cluster assembly protein SufB, partial [Actinomycetota bacterium]
MTTTDVIEELAKQEYKYGFVTAIESDSAPRGLNEDTIRIISSKKNEPGWMLEWRLKSYRHWASLEQLKREPKWANIHYGP